MFSLLLTLCTTKYVKNSYRKHAIPPERSSPGLWNRDAYLCWYLGAFFIVPRIFGFFSRRSGFIIKMLQMILLRGWFIHCFLWNTPTQQHIHGNLKSPIPSELFSLPISLFNYLSRLKLLHLKKPWHMCIIQQFAFYLEHGHLRVVG